MGGLDLDLGRAGKLDLMDSADVLAYLRRIEAPAPAEPSGDLLRELHLRHLRTVPFENLSIHLGEPIVLAEAALFDKIVRRRRGGFCYELNGAFAGLLRALGFEVTLLSAQVHLPDGTFSPPGDHLALQVNVPGSAGVQRWVADVGFGRHSTYPLRLDRPEPQHDPDGEFLIVDSEPACVDVIRDGSPQYRLDLRRRQLADFVPTCWWQQTSPQSHFRTKPTCSLATADGRITLSEDRLITTTGDQRTDQQLVGDQQILQAYRTHFGVVLDRVPATIRR